ncbi:MAG: NfeD family protein [Chloroflexota bacterium]
MPHRYRILLIGLLGLMFFAPPLFTALPLFAAPQSGWMPPVVPAAAAALPAATAQAAEAPRVILVRADGALTPAMKEHLGRALQLAAQSDASAVVYQLDTPGGSIALMTEMVEQIRTSRVPVIVYIAPRGAMAGSAGTVLTLAGHAAAMAPETTIGAASPVGSSGEDLGETMEAKTKNILKATVRGLAERRGPQAVRLAEETIESASAVSASEALQIGLIDFIAADLADLLRQADGLPVTLDGQPAVLRTAGAQVQEAPPTLVEELLGILANPTIVFLLLAVGVQAVLIEISSPGGWAAGTLGVVCLALAGYGLGLLTVNWFGLVFLILAFVLFILDIKAPTHGALTAAGVAALIAGGLVLFNSPNVPSFQRVPVPLIVGVSLATGLIFFGLMLFGVRAQRTPQRMGAGSLRGRSGVVLVALDPSGQVRVGGEQWSAELAPGQPPLAPGEPVQVQDVSGVRLIVIKAPRDKS